MCGHQILKTVVVAAKTLLQHAHRQNRLKIHPRTAGVAPPIRKNVLVQKSKQLSLRRLVLVDRLKTDQKRRVSSRDFAFSLISSIGIDPKRAPQFRDRPHAKSFEDSPIGRKRGRIIPHLVILRNRNRTIQSKDSKN